MQRAFAEQNIRDVQRVSAVDGNEVVLPHNWIHTPGAYGCLLSHVQVVRAARDAGASSVLIFEDDAVFDPQFKEEFAWSGTFGKTKDALPYICAYKKTPSAYYALGFGGNGITFSVIAAEILRDIICGKYNAVAKLFSFER